MCIKIIYVRLCKTRACVCHTSIWGGSWNRGIPKSSIYRWIFPTYKPSSYGGSLIYGTPHRCPLCEPTSWDPQEPECGNSGWHALPTRVARHILWLWPIAASEHGPNFFIFLTMVPKILLKAMLIHFFGKSTLIGISCRFASYKPTAWRWNSKWSNWPAARWVLRIGTGCKRLGTGALPWDMMDMTHQTWLLRKKKGKVL